MKYLLLFLLLVMITPLGQAQSPVVEALTPLAAGLKENSGLLNLNGTLITHNDSDGDSSLFEVDSETGAITRTVVVTNAENHDWEDIAQDPMYIYIGDFGNNNGDRTNLRIYRIAKSDYQDRNNSVQADLIAFSYPDQTDFTPNVNTNFDAEALVVLQDSLYIFTKNWANRQSTVYSLPKTPGTYVAKKLGSLETQGLVTGGTYHTEKNEIMLVGYTPLQAFAYSLSEINGYNILAAKQQRLELNLGVSAQVEGICSSNDNGYFISSEGTVLAPATLYHLSFGTTTSSGNLAAVAPVTLYPNPTKSWLHVVHPQQVLTEIFDTTGRKILVTSHTRINLAHLRRGVYLVRISKENGETLAAEKLLLE
ncbi:T9SS type A sorting domain-containing protein [Pontibacter sp. 13R65]|uniref:T9SS type A sorting domain-containing protein n=1 Tax=Pontibacter sp. 13R65 TaxID=3127458 RepID=UPI00301E2317